MVSLIPLQHMEVGIVFNSFDNQAITPEEVELKKTSLRVGSLLAEMGYSVSYFDMDSPESIIRLCEADIDIAFDTCERIHGDPRGEAYSTALLEYLGIPHTRTSSFFIANGINKVRIKKIFAYHGISIPKYQVFLSPDEELHENLHYPLFVKGVASENSIGIDENSFVTTPSQLREKISQILLSLNQPALVEEFIDGREFSVSILPGEVNQCLPITEIQFNGLPIHQRYLDYKAKWIPDSDRYLHTPPVIPEDLEPEEEQKIRDLAFRCFKVLGLDSYARVDMRCKEKELYVLEVNQNPSIEESDSGYVRACRKIGLGYKEILQVLLKNALLIDHENPAS